jgi:hypothetical protein
VTGPFQRPQHAPGARRTPFVVLVLGLIAGGMLALLALNTASAANEVRRHDIADADQSVAAQVEQLQIDARNSAAPGNLARAAQALGMVPAGNPGFIEIARNGDVRVLGHAAPATALPVYVPPKPKSAKHRERHGNNADARAKPKKKHDTQKKKHDTQKKQTAQRDAKDRKHAKHQHSRSHHAATEGGANPAPQDSATPTPTPTPTPTITLPGGDR